MILISHRGNLTGPDIERENQPRHIHECLNKGLNVEIDVWYKDGLFFLGHDTPQYEVSSCFLKNQKLWCHAKNLDALYKMADSGSIHYFWHQKDDFTLTSQNIIWTYPGNPVTLKSVIVTDSKIIDACYGVCTDYPLEA